MKPVPLLHRDLVLTHLAATDLAGALDLLVRALADAGRIHGEADVVCAALAGHALRATVRVGPDIALPHYRTAAVDSVAVALGIAKSAVETGDPGWSPGPRVVGLVLAPIEATTAYLQTVSSLARALRSEGVLPGLLAAETADEVISLDGLAGIEIRPRLAVRDVVSPAVETVTPDQPLRTAVEQMIRTGSGALIVVGEKSEVIGLLREVDVMRGLGLDRTRPTAEPLLPPLKVRDVMSRSVMCTADRASLDEVAGIMINKDVDEVPVVSGGRLTGVIRRRDILGTLYGR